MKNQNQSSKILGNPYEIYPYIIWPSREYLSKKKNFSYGPILFQNVKKNIFPCKYVHFLRKKSECARNAKNPFPYLHFHVTMWTGEVIVMKARLQVLPTSTPSVHVIIIFVIARLQEANCPHRRALKKQFCGTSLENLEKTPTLLPLIPLLLLRKLYPYLLIRNIFTKYSLPTCAPVTYMLIHHISAHSSPTC